jgi:hypothetical protein
MEEMYELLKDGGNLQEITIEVGLHYLGPAERSHSLKIENLLKPLERLNSLKSANVKGTVAEIYKAKLSRN